MGWVPVTEYPWMGEDPWYKYSFEIDGVECYFFPEGETCVIARMRRGKYAMIPSEWRGKVTRPSKIRGRISKRPHKQRRGHVDKYAVKGDEQLTMQERRAPMADEDW